MADETLSAQGILTEYEIKFHRLIRRDDKDINDNCYSNASFDFRLDDEYYIPNGANKIKKCSDELGMLIIPSYTSAVIGTYENVSLPNNIAGRFDLRITWAMAGLILQVGTQIEPGYDGKLFGVLHNLSNTPIKIPYKDHKNTLLTAEFHYTSYPTKPKVGQRDKLYKIQDFISKGIIHGSLLGLFDIIKEKNLEVQRLASRLDQRVEKELESINRVLDRVTTAERSITTIRENNMNNFWNKQNIMLIVSTVLLTIFIPVVLSLITPTKEMRELRDSLKKEIELNQKQRNELDSLKRDFFERRANKKSSTDTLSNN